MRKRPKASRAEASEENIQSLAERHPLLYHYTTATGLKGIIESQQLHATSIGFLNDAEERIGFFKHQLPKLVTKSVDTAFDERMKSIDFRQGVAKDGGLDKCKQEEVTKWIEILENNSTEFNDPYVVSFSSPPERDPENGLLSQWRAYGPDGGYAIVFDSSGLEQLLIKELQIFQYAFATAGSVDYYNKDSSGAPKHPETRKWLAIVHDVLKKFLRSPSPSPSDIEPLIAPLVFLSVTHKHRGFSEEAEARIVVLRPVPEVDNAAKNNGNQKPVKPLEFRLRQGTPVPYVALFGKEIGRLPITKIIVGPHPDKEKRKVAVEALLRQKGFHVDQNTVITSTIPYLGT